MVRMVRLPQHKFGKQILFFASLSSLFLLSYFGVFFLHHASLEPDRYRGFLSLVLFLFFIPTLLSWFSMRWIGAVFFVVVAAAFAVLSASVTQLNVFLIFIPTQAVLCFLLLMLDQMKHNEIVIHEVEIEKEINERNDLELTFREKGTSISVLFEKYASYYNLRNLAVEFSTTLSLTELSQMIISKTSELILRGETYLLFLTEPDSGSLSLLASKAPSSGKQIKPKTGNIFDSFVIRNRQSLIVMDTQRDFRFDLKKAVEIESIRSVIASPLIHEGKVVGTLRISSSTPDRFSTDDLRLLDAIATLASSAVSNSIVFQKTEELAIRDSLTDLYVHRYFLERLSEEHRRSLLTKTPIALLMCDLDHFKNCNDRYGHGVGDMVLTETAKILSQAKHHGIVARYGGEEFAILIPKAAKKEGKIAAEMIRAAVSDMKVTVRRETIAITISIGVASIPEDTLDAEELIRLADERLYEAKKGGRNQVC